MQTIKELYREFTSFEASLFRYSFAFSLLLALAPALTIFAYLFEYAYLDINILIDFISKILPNELIVPYVDFILAKKFTNYISLIVTIGVAFWFASRSIYSLMLINANHEDIDLPKWSIRILSIFVFIFIAILIVIIIFINTKLSAYLPLVASGGMFILFYLLYRSLSFYKKDLMYGVMGGLFATLGILVVAYLFLGIVNHFTSYTTVYGPLASIVVLTLALYVISSIIYFGYCLNVVFDEHKFKGYKYSVYSNLCIKLNNKFMKNKRKLM